MDAHRRGRRSHAGHVVEPRRGPFPDREALAARGAPVAAFARAVALPLDIIVQPQAMPGAAPLVLAFIGGRCKLVLSMRGNTEAQGTWLRQPAGIAASEPEGLGADLREAYANMQAIRRKEGNADLVGLAWARQRHPRLGIGAAGAPAAR